MSAAGTPFIGELPAVDLDALLGATFTEKP